jgi:hypothetical protein
MQRFFRFYLGLWGCDFLCFYEVLRFFLLLWVVRIWFLWFIRFKVWFLLEIWEGFVRVLTDLCWIQDFVNHLFLWILCFSFFSDSGYKRVALFVFYFPYSYIFYVLRNISRFFTLRGFYVFLWYSSCLYLFWVIFSNFYCVEFWFHG